MASALQGRVFDAVIFDLDQTLVDSAQALGEAWGRWMAEYDVEPDTSRSWHGWTSEDIIRLCLPEERVDEGLARIEELEVATTHAIRALPGAAETLDALPADRVAIGTSGTHAVARARLEAAGLRPSRVLVTASDVAEGKPAPDIFLAAARQLGADPSRCLVVEDAPTGVEAARAAGMATLAVLTSTPPDRIDADAQVRDLSHVRWQVESDGIRVELD
ncbi:HAD family hydrolase [Luteococcus sp. Sow4_B9]|uniref:HAD family hydrolase n=1 Tax=Luteococcus sp. Sow4_B9 TaxID=3438792 RepID=UPI003F994FC1